MPSGKTAFKVNAYFLALFVKQLVDGPVTAAELVEMTGLSRITVQRQMRAFVKVGAAHVSAWETDRLGRWTVPVYKLGPGKRAVRRTATNAERRAKYVAKMKALKTLQMMAGTITPGEQHEDRNRAE